MTGPDTSGVPPAATDSPSAPGLSRALLLGVFSASLVLSCMAVGMLHWVWSRQVAELEMTVKREERREQELASVKRENEIYQFLIQDLSRRIDTIEQLQHSRVGPRVFMRTLDKVMAMSGGVSLRTADPQGSRVVLSGQSHSLESMTSFLAHLERSRNFSDVQLRQFYQDKGQATLSYKFNLDCVYSPGRNSPPSPAPPRR